MSSFFSMLYEIIRRNPLTTLLLVMLAVAAPGVFGVFALMLVVPLLIIAVGALAIMWRMRKVKKQMEEQLRDHHRRTTGSTYTATDTTSEGKVTVHIPPQEKRVSDGVGEYVDFREE